MDELASSMLNEEIKRLLGTMHELNPSSDDFAVVADNLAALVDIVNSDRKAVAELTCAITDSEKEEKKHEIEKEQLKVEKRKLWIECGIKSAYCVAAGAVPMIIAIADHKGWYFSRTALSSVPKIKM